MSASIIGGGRHYWEGDVDTEGHRTYKVSHRIVTTSPHDGPNVVMNTPGIPLIGSVWSFGNDFDDWAFCYPDLEVQMYQHKEGEPHHHWKVTQTFSTKPINQCQDDVIEDPLLQPARLSGGFDKYTKEITTDKNGNYVLTSSLELIRGPQMEFDHNRPTVIIEINTGSLDLATFTDYIDSVNNNSWWGMGTRTVKLSNISWERKTFGTCNFYYVIRYEFDIDSDGWDRTVLDEGTKVLNGHWGTTGTNGGWILDDVDGSAPDPSNAQHFMRAIDRAGNPTRVVLDGAGSPIDDGAAGTVDIEYYKGRNFATLGIPSNPFV